jgi:hypothetical protein
MKQILQFICFVALCSFTQQGAYNERKAYLRSQGYAIVDEYYSDLKQGETTYKYRSFSKDGRYVVFAMSEDTDVEDIDLYVYESNGEEYVQDNTVKRMAAVDINPLVTRELKMVVKNYKSRTPNYASRCRFLVAYKE